MYHGHIFALDDIRITSTSKRDKFKTKLDKIPKVLAIDIHSVCTATKKYHGFFLNALPVWWNPNSLINPLCTLYTSLLITVPYPLYI